MSTLQQQIEKLGVYSEGFDEIVDQAALRVASVVNNKGMAAQIRYLEEAGMSESEILQSVKDLL